MILYSKQIYVENKKIAGYLTIEDGKIVRITQDNPNAGEVIDYSDKIIIPGYIDIHIHGWGTGGYWSEKTPESLYRMKKELPETGVTSFLGTTGTDALSAIHQGIEAANVVYGDQKEGAELLGVHLEGPFISKEFRGMQREEYCIDPSLEVMEAFIAKQDHDRLIKMMTIAPELPNAKEVIQFCHEHGIQVSVGHSGATFDEITAVKDYGIGGVIHMYSGMKGLHHRELGVAGTAMYYPDLMCEFAKQTGNTVRHEAFDIVYRLKGADGVYLTTDCVALAKMDREFHHYIRQETFIPQEGGMVKVVKDSGEFYMIDSNDYEAVKDLELGFADSVKNMAAHSDVTMFDVIKMTSTNPAKYIQVDDRKGYIKEGYDADLLVIDEDYNVYETYCRGVKQAK